MENLNLRCYHKCRSALSKVTSACSWGDCWVFLIYLIKECVLDLL